jgi:hypothetical protein
MSDASLLQSKTALRLVAAVLLGNLCSACVTQPTSTGFSAADYVAIQQLYAEFNTSLDLGLPDRYVKTWTDDGEFQGGRTGTRATPAAERKPDVVGRDAIYQMAARGGGGGRHSVTNLVITPAADGKSAKASCYLILLNARSSPPTVGETAIYDDTLVKTKDGWKFRKRINWRDDDPYSPNKPKEMPAGQLPPGAPPS